LIEASSVEPPLLIKPYYDEMVKKEEGEGAKVFVDFKKPSEMIAEDYTTIVSKSNWNINIRYSLFSINKASEAVPIRLCHLLMHLAFKLKIFGNDAFGKVSSRCKVAANAVNHLLEVNTVFFPAGSVRAKIPLCVCPLNKETFKSAVVDLLKCTNNTNVQRFYVGDGDGNVEVAGLGIPPAALTDGVSPGAETLFKWSLHEVKALFESQTQRGKKIAGRKCAPSAILVLLTCLNKMESEPESWPNFQPALLQPGVLTIAIRRATCYSNHANLKPPHAGGYIS
jgi:hypothetical protein